MSRLTAQLTKNFHSTEFDCKSGAITPCIILLELKELAINLQVLRDEIKAPIDISSGYRTVAYNATIKGAAKESKHTIGQAADIKVRGWTPQAVFNKIEELIKAGKMKQGGLEAYNTFVHYDIRGIKARW